MGKHEAPPFRMLIQGGRLVPATPYDAERLDTYRNGMEVRVRLTEDRDRVMVRKWWAILNRAVKECKTPWKTADQASEAIKLSIGVVNYTKTVGGKFMAYPKSLTELEDPELTEAVEQMIDVVHAITGVDPAEWRKQVEHIRDEEPPSVTRDADGAGSDVDDPKSPDVAADPSNPVEKINTPDQEPAAADPGAGGQEEAHPVASSPAPDLARKRECIEKLLRIATERDLTPKERAENLGQTAEIWTGELPRDFVQPVFDTCRKVIKAELQADAARRYLESLL